MAGQSTKDRLEIQCPLCRGTLTIDLASGVVLHATAPQGPSKDFEAALGEVRAAENRRDEQFVEAFRAEKQRRESLDKKFETAQEKAAKDPKKLINPMDYD